MAAQNEKALETVAAVFEGETTESLEGTTDMSMLAQTPVKDEATLLEWRDKRRAGEEAPWPFETPSWVETIKVSGPEFDDDEIAIWLSGRSYTAGEFEAYVDQMIVVVSNAELAKGADPYFVQEKPCIVIGDLRPDHTVEHAEQIASLLSAAAAELRCIESELND